MLDQREWFLGFINHTLVQTLFCLHGWWCSYREKAIVFKQKNQIEIHLVATKHMLQLQLIYNSSNTYPTTYTTCTTTLKNHLANGTIIFGNNLVYKWGIRLLLHYYTLNLPLWIIFFAWFLAIMSCWRLYHFLLLLLTEWLNSFKMHR